MSSPRVFVYGCYGYTGVLICEEAKKRGVDIIVGGRNKEKTFDIAKRLKIDPNSPDNPSDEYVRIFGLDDESVVAEQLSGLPDDVTTVLNVAGPYSKTFVPMVKGCLANELSYLDVTGEIDVFEAAQLEYSQAAKDKGVIVMPGCGLDVVPTDCLAKHLQERLPTADTLELAWGSQPVEEGSGASGGASRGTANTMVEQSGARTLGRRNGKIQPISYSTLKVPLHVGRPNVPVTAISWGDVSTAYHSTRIPNITTYFKSPGALGWGLYLNSLWIVRKITKHLVPQSVKKSFVPAWGPSKEELDAVTSSFWGRATNSKTGESVTSRANCISAYPFTALAAVEIARRVSKMSRDEVREKSGAHTPSTLFGAQLLSEIDSTASFIEIDDVKKS